MNELQKEEWIRYYCCNNMYNLKKISYPIIVKLGGVYQKDYDDFYSIAQETLLSACNYYKKTIPFEKFFKSCLMKKFDTELRARNTDKRKANNGKYAISIDMLIGMEDSLAIGDMLASDFEIEKELPQEWNDSTDEKVETYLNSLSKIQKQIVEMKMEEVSVAEIKKKLGLTNSQYQDQMQSIRQNRWVALFNKRENEKTRKKMEETKVKEKKETTDFVMDMDTTDNYRMDKYSLNSLLEDKKDGEIDCHYISQRQPFQWEEKQVNKFFSRILNNQPIPEIVICEMMVEGEKVSYLVEGLQRLSYAEEFKENRMPVKAKGAEFTNIKYKKYELDKSGKKVLDASNRPKFVIDTFDIAGKYYRDLPEFLQKRFNNFNVNVTRFFDCTPEIIDYHMRNYNNHVAMTKSQYGITNVTNDTSRNIKFISEQHPFFKDKIKCTSKNRRKGVLDEVVARSIAAIHFLPDWKKELIDILAFVDANATEELFEHFRNQLDRLNAVMDQSVQDLFNTTNAYIWFAVFDRFTRLHIPDIRFVEFMSKFKETLHSKEINGESYDTVNTRNTKDKTTVIRKIDMIEALMLDYLHSEPEKKIEAIQIPQEQMGYVKEFSNSEITRIFNIKTEQEIQKTAMEVLLFVMEQIDSDKTQEDVILYLSILEEWTLHIKGTCGLLCKENLPSLIGLVAYSCDMEYDDFGGGWLQEFTKKNYNYKEKQEENYYDMKRSLNQYIRRMERKAV